ncbi:intraflagellar transport protein 25 homolog [Aplochiton taeniatus]
MIETALKSLGGQVVLATSSDENHPPDNIIDGNTETFWVSTGMFPQEFIIRLTECLKVNLLTMHSHNVKTLKIEKTSSTDATDFVSVAEKEFENTEGSLQANDILLNGISATHLRFIITAGYDHFVSVNRVSVES